MRPRDFPDLPHLAQLLDRVPKERRIIIDCTGVYNKTSRSNTTATTGSSSTGTRIGNGSKVSRLSRATFLQPTLTPLRDDVSSFLFFGYDPSAVALPYSSPEEAAKAWAKTAPNHATSSMLATTGNAGLNLSIFSRPLSHAGVVFWHNSPQGLGLGSSPRLGGCERDRWPGRGHRLIAACRREDGWTCYVR